MDESTSGPGATRDGPERTAPRKALSGTTAEKVRTALRRMTRTVETRPGRATGTAVTRVRVVDGMTCEVREGEWDFLIDLPERWGGGGGGPSPGVVGRGALGACLSMAYCRWAADAGLPIDRLEVEIQADYDARGELGMADVTPAYTEVRYIVEVESPAPAEEVRRVLALAEERCPYLEVFAAPMPMRRELRLAGAEQGPAATGRTGAPSAASRSGGR